MLPRNTTDNTDKNFIFIMTKTGVNLINFKNFLRNCFKFITEINNAVNVCYPLL